MNCLQPTRALTGIILTYNESLHLERCIRSISSFCSRIVVVDSFSTDSTLEIAYRMGVEVFQNKFVNQAQQFNWALSVLSIDSPWILRIDADEVAMPELARTVVDFLVAQPSKVAGISVNRRIYFMNRWIKRGGVYPIRTLRFIRNGRGRCEDRWMDEHLTVDGEIHHLDYDIADINLNNLTWWIGKHNHYATREAIQVLIEERSCEVRSGRAGITIGAKIKRILRSHFYSRMPIGWRAFCYFAYRYFILLGFLEGKHGLAFHFLQGCWYRFLVDVKVLEIKSMMIFRNEPLAAIVKKEYGYDL